MSFKECHMYRGDEYYSSFFFSNENFYILFCKKMINFDNPNEF